MSCSADRDIIPWKILAMNEEWTISVHKKFPANHRKLETIAIIQSVHTSRLFARGEVARRCFSIRDSGYLFKDEGYDQNVSFRWSSVMENCHTIESSRWVLVYFRRYFLERVSHGNYHRENLYSSLTKKFFYLRIFCLPFHILYAVARSRQNRRPGKGR